MSVLVSENLGAWYQTWERYWRVFSGTFNEALAKQAKEFTNACYIAARAMSHPKGFIRAERLAALKQGIVPKFHDYKIGGGVNEMVGSQSELLQRRLGGGTWTSANARRLAARTKSKFDKLQIAFGGKRGMTMQALKVEMELANRESHRMFAASAWYFQGSLGGRRTNTVKAGGYPLTSYEIKQAPEGPTAQFLMSPGIGNASAHAATIYLQPRNRAVIETALKARVVDMEKYISRKHDEAASRAARSLR